MPLLFSVCLFPGIVCRSYFPYVHYPALYAIFFRLRLLARHICRFLTSFIAAGLYPAFFFYSLGCHPSHFHTFIHRCGFILCLFRHKTLPISAYLGIKWHIFVKSDFFSSIGLLVTYPILYLCIVKGQSGSPTDANGVHPVGRAAHIRVTSLKTQF